MAIAQRGSGTRNLVTGVTTITAPSPVGLADGDVMIAMVVASDGTAPTPPSGWTVIGSGNGFPSYWVGLAVRSGSTGMTWTTANPTYIQLALAAFSGVYGSGPQDAIAATANGSGTTTIDPPSITTISPNDMVVGVGFNGGEASAGLWQPPSGYTSSVATVQFDVCAMVHKLVATPGTEDPGAITGGSAPDVWRAWTISLREPPLTTYTKTGIAVIGP